MRLERTPKRVRLSERTLVDVCARVLALRIRQISNQHIEAAPARVWVRVWQAAKYAGLDSLEFWVRLMYFKPSIGIDSIYEVQLTNVNCYVDLPTLLESMRVPLPEAVGLWLVVRDRIEISTSMLLSIADIPKLHILDLSQALWPSGSDLGRVLHTLNLILQRGGIKHIFLPRRCSIDTEFPEDWPLAVQTIETPLAPCEEVWKRTSREKVLFKGPLIKFMLGEPSSILQRRARRYRRISSRSFN